MQAGSGRSVWSRLFNGNNLAAKRFFGLVNNPDGKPVTGAGFGNEQRLAIQRGNAIAQSSERFNGDSNRGNGQLSNNVGVDDAFQLHDLIVHL